MERTEKTILRTVRRAARSQLGHEKLYPGQEDALVHVLAGRDTLAVMPTGAGKSAIYQLAAYELPGPTVVVSPLIALQQDQVETINDILDVGAAAVLNSTLSASERTETLEGVQREEVEFIFLAPEQFAAEEVLEELKRAQPSLFVIDEAHCITEWGHDFRPDYLRLNAAIEALGHPTLLALTATAAPPVREEIVARLGMRNPVIVVRGFDRPNIELSAAIYGDEHAKWRACLDEVEAAAKPGLVYAATRKHADELAQALVERGVAAAAYHAGLRAAEREEIRTAFMADELAVVVATTAFGMGIDKPNVAFVFHYDIPGSVDAYYQEIGRAGRSGQPARAVLFYRPEDLHLQRFFAGGGLITADQVEQVLHVLIENEEPNEIGRLKQALELSQSKLMSALSELERLGIVALLPDGQVALCEMPDDMGKIADATTLAQERRRQLQKSRVEMMRGYAETHACRRAYLLNYFGEEFSPPCGNCDNCAAGATAEPAQAQDRPFPLNSRVVHTQWGGGLVTHCDGDKVTVLFDEAGYKSLALAVVLENGLLRSAE